MSHMTRIPLSRSNGQRSRSQGTAAYCGGLPPTACYRHHRYYCERCTEETKMTLGKYIPAKAQVSALIQ